MKRRSNKQIDPLVKAIIVGTLIAIGSIILLSAIIAWLVQTEKVDIQAMEWLNVVIQAISTFAGTWVALTVGKEKLGVITGIMAGCILFTLLGCSMLFFASGFQGLIGSVITILAGSVAACLIKLKIVTKTKRGKRRAFR